MILKKCICSISPKLMSKYLYYKKFRKKLNLKVPQKFNEKLMWLKLNVYNQNQLVWKCCDKYRLRRYAIEHGVKEENLTPIIKVYDSAKKINFDELPDKFALKCSHGCGFNIICTDKSKLNRSETINKLDKWMNTKFGYETAELHYTHLKPKIICEKFIGSQDTFPWDYKIYCFNGEPKVILVCTNREEKYKTHFYNIEWEQLMLRNNQEHEILDRPETLVDMLDISRKLAPAFPFVRIDFYELKGKAILGEMTFTPAACLAEYTEEGDKYLSDLLKLPQDGGVKSEH